MEPNTDFDPRQYQTPANIWAGAFARAFLELVQGEEDIHGLIDWGYELWPVHGKRDAATVAQEMFDATV